MIQFNSTGLPEPAAPVLSQDAFMRSAMEQPLSPMATFFEGVQGGALESYGLGTVIREFGNAPLADVPENQPASLLGQAADMAVNAFPPVMAYKAYKKGFQSLAGLDQETPVLDKAAYERSPYSRPNIPWEPGMTEARAASLATWNDAKQVRDFYREKRPIASFLGAFGGQALDPINYIPVGGEFLAARTGLGVIGKAALGSSVEAAVNTAVAGVATSGTRASFGDDTSWQAMVSDIAVAGLIGAGFGTIGGAFARRGGARAEAEAAARLGTLKRTQEARVALNEAIDGLINDGEVHLSPNGLAAVDNAAAEMRRLSDAYDQTLTDIRSGTPGSRFDPIVQITPADIEGAFVSRGGFRGAGDVEVKGAGFGLVKFIVRHGEMSTKDVADQIAREDILAFPNVIREFAPEIDANGRRTWITEAPDGRHIAYGESEVTGRPGQKALVTVHVENRGRPLSRRLEGRSPSETFAGPAGDTAPTAWLRPSESGLDALMRQPATLNIAPEPRAANGTPRAEPAPDGLAAASGRVAKSEDVRALAEQHGVDPKTGDFAEQADLEQVEMEGRLTDADRATLDDAAKTFEDGDAFAKALGAAVSCII
jgi:hypothetical protein